MRVLFMGTPDYSVATLKALVDEGFDVAGVFAQPDKPVGRKQILTPPPVKAYAESIGIPVYQPTTLRDGKALEIIKEINPEVIVVVAYGKILPEEILNFPKYKCINGHASLLPKYRGASPIQWCIVCGEKQTGVTIQVMDKGIDTGDILDTAVVDIGENETAEELFERLSVVSADLMIKTLKSIESGTAKPIKQNEDEATYAPIIKKEMAHLDFNKTAYELKCAIRGYYSWPCAFCFIEGKRVKVISADIAEGNGEAGTVVDNNGRLVIACGGNTAIELKTVQPEGSKVMSAAQMLCGFKIPIGTTLN